MMLLYKILFSSIGRKTILPYIVKKQGGEKESAIIRKFYSEKYKVNIGMYTYGGCFSYNFNVGGTVNVGRYCSIAENVHYYGANHPVEHSIMSPYFYNRAFGEKVEDVKRETLDIGNDIWCGSGVIITNKCTSIGNGSVIGAGAVVTKNIPPYAIAAGNPARILRYRFSEETIAMLEKTKWWDNSPQELMKYYGFISNPEQFAEAILKQK